MTTEQIVSAKIRRPLGILMAALTVLVSSCASLTPVETVPKAIKKNRGEIHLVQRDSSKVVLRSPVIRGDSIWGYHQEKLGKYFRGYALSDVSSVAVPSSAGTVTVLLAITGLVVLLMVASQRYCTLDCNH
jgi:hypothetical protein